MGHAILVIDDSPEIHALLTVRLRGEASALLHAHGADEGMSLARAQLPDLVLLDVNMQGTSGFDVCRALKSDPATAGIPIIFLSGDIEQETKVKGLDLGAMDYITKPFEVAELKARVRSALRIKTLQDQLLALARIDDLTQAWNRAYFETRLSEEMSASQRHGRAFALVLLDIDFFKRVNDRHGHPAGDAVLREVANTLRQSVRANDAVCRFGGEEFALILPDTRIREAMVVAERCRVAVEATPIGLTDHTLHVTASLGVATSEMVPSNQALQLVTLADAALYEAKNDGRNTVRIAVSRR